MRAIVVAVVVWGGALSPLEASRPAPRVLEPLIEPTAVAVAADGSVFVTEAGAHRVAVFDRAGRLVRRFGRFGRAPGDFDHPCGIAIGEDGLVYVADTGNQRVEVFTAAGAFVRAWGGPGTADGAFEEPRGLAVRGDRVAVTDAKTHRVQWFDHEGRFIAFLWKHGALPGAFDRPVGVALGADGSSFVVDQGNARVQHFDPDGHLLAAWGGRGRAGVLTIEPGGIALGSRGVLVADALDGRVVATDTEGALLGEWVVPGIDAVDDVAWLGEGLVACSSTRGRCVVADALSALPTAEDAPARGPARRGYAAGGRGDDLVLASRASGVLTVIDLAPPVPVARVSVGRAGREWLEIARPEGFSFDAASGTLLIADTGNARLQRLRLARAGDAYDPAGTRFERGLSFDDAEALYANPGRWTLEPAGLEPGPFVVLDDGRLCIADDVAHRLVLLDPESGAVTSWGAAGDADGRFRAVRAVAIDRDAHLVYALDDRRRRVQAFDLDGRLVAAWGSRALFDEPAALAVAHDGSVLVLDRATSRVTRFDPRGRVLARWGGRGTGPRQFIDPEALHVDGRGRVVVIDSGNARAQILSADGRYAGEFALDLDSNRGQVALAPGSVGTGQPVPGVPCTMSSGGSYRVCWTVDAFPVGQPFAAEVAITDTHTGEPARAVVFDVDATMPEHGHGLTLKPMVRASAPSPLELPPGHGAIGDGAFRVRGLLFHMPGLWRLHADVTRGAITERADLDVVLD